MELHDDRCYRALSARDARFDGHFFTAVVTTGIYCRPVCPARTPKRRNVRFFPTAAAASEAGFRPCLRCRPESSPGTPAWNGTSATVARGLRLIQEGALDAEGVDALARRLGIGERHLRRLFREHVGATPIAVAQTRRLLFAKKLIDETSLPMTQIAHAAGYTSVRRFNTAVHAAYGVAPSSLRRGAARSTSQGVLELRLAYRPPLAVAPLFGFFAARALPGVEVATPRCYRRTVMVDGVPGVLEVEALRETHGLRLRVPRAFAGELARVAQQTRRMFDLDAEPGAIQPQLARDPLLRAGFSGAPGLRVPGAWDGFELAVRAILGQQVSVAGANTLAGRLVARFGASIPEPSPGLERLFPTPEILARAPVEEIGIPGRRADAVRALAAAALDGPLFATDDGARDRLLALPGIGPWTVEYVAMRALRDPDAMPTGDLVLRRMASRGTRPLGERALAARAERWRPWRAYAVMALWRAAAAQRSS